MSESPKQLSTASAVLNFFALLPPGNKGGTRSVYELICQTYNLQKGSLETDVFLHAQRDNLIRLHKEIDFSNIGSEAKPIYAGSIRNLSNVLNNQLNVKNWQHVRAQIDDALKTLVIMDDKLQLGVPIPETAKADISDFVSRLEAIYSELSDADIPPKLKIVLMPQIANLIMLLRNFEVLGFDRAWEVASAAMMTAAREFKYAESQPTKRRLGKLVAVLAVGVGLLASVNSGIEQAEKLISNVGDLFSAIEESQREEMPRLEHKPTQDPDTHAVHPSEAE